MANFFQSGFGLGKMQMKRYNQMPSDKYNELPWMNIDHSRLSILRHFHDTNPIAVRCRNYVLQHLTSSPIEVEMDGKTVKFDAEFSDFFQEHYTRFLCDAYDSFMTFGIVPMALIQTENRHFVPRVLKHGTFWIQVAYVTESEEMYYRAFRKPAHVITRRTCNSAGVRSMEELYGIFGSQLGNLFGSGRGMSDGAASGIGQSLFDAEEENYSGWIYDDSVHFITGLGYDPHIDGTIRSPISSIFGELMLTNTLTRHMVRADRLMAEPPLTMQYHKDEKEEDLSPYQGAMNGTFYSKDGFRKERREKVEMTERQLKQASEFWRQIQSNVDETLYMQDAYGPKRILKEVVKNDNYIVIPRGLEHFKLDSNIAQAGRNAMAQRKMLDDHTAGLYGVPLNIFRNEGALRGNIQAQTALFHMMLRSHAEMIGGMMTASFGNIYVKLSDAQRATMFPRKGLIDRQTILSYGIKQAAKEGEYIIKDETSELAPPPSISSVILNHDLKTKLEDDDDEHREIVDNSAVEERAIASVLADNEKTRKELMSKRTRERKKKKKNVSFKNKPSNELPKFRKHSRYQFTVRIPVGHLLGNNDLNDLYSIGAITPQRYRELKLSRSGFKAVTPDDDLNEAERRIMEMMRDGNGSGVSMDPNGNVISLGTGQVKEKIPIPVLLELARNNGNVEKTKKQRRADEASLRSRAMDGSSSESGSESESESDADSKRKRKRHAEESENESDSSSEKNTRKKTKKKKKGRGKASKDKRKPTSEDETSDRDNNSEKEKEKENENKRKKRKTE